MYQIDRALDATPVEVTPEERGNIALLELARRLRTDSGPQQHFDMMLVANCGTPSCAFGWAGYWKIAGLSMDKYGSVTLNGEHQEYLTMAVRAFALSPESTIYAVHGWPDDGMLLFGAGHKRTPQDQASIIESFVASRRAKAA